jgi:sphingomyelin phosphodiesterase
VWLVTDTEVTNDLENAYSLMSSSLSIPVYGATGNHDVSPVNSFPPNDISTMTNSTWAYDVLSSEWDQWIGSTAAAQADNYGAYSYSLSDYNLRIISINTNLYYKENFWLYEKTMETGEAGRC